MSSSSEKCNNCGQMTTGDYCEWCGHPLNLKRHSPSKKLFLTMALVLALVVSGGAYAYTYTTNSATVFPVGGVGDFATSNATANATQPDWESVLPSASAETLRPDATGDTTDISSQYPDSGAHWDKVDEEVADDWSTYIYTSSTNYETSLYSISGHSGGSGTIYGVTIYFRFAGNTGHTGYAKAAIKTHDTTYEGNAESQTDQTFVNESYTWTINPNTSSAWTWGEIDTLQAGVSLRGSSGYNAYCTQVYVEVDYAATYGEVPTGDLFEVTCNQCCPGDVQVHTYLTNVAALTKAYQYLNMKLYLQDSVEASQDPNYQLLTLNNGTVTFNLQSCFRESAARTWTQTTQADFEGGTTNQLDTTSSPGDVALDYTSSSVTDSYNDETKIASKTNVAVSSGQVKLTYLHGAGTETLRPNSAGDSTSLSYQDPDSGAHWDKVDEETTDDLATYVYTDYTSYQQDLYNLADTGIGSGSINSVSLYYRYASKVGPRYGGIYAIGYEESANELAIKTLQVYNYGVLAAPIIDYVKIDEATNAIEPVILRIRDNVIVIAYDGAGEVGWLKTVYITGEGQVTDITDSLQYDTTGINPDIINVSGDIYAIAYTGPGGQGKLTTVEISQDGLIGDAIIDTLTFDSNTGDDPNLVHVSGNIFAIAYQGKQGDGYVATVEIAPDGQIANSVIDSYEHCTSNADRPDIAHVSGNIFAIAYGGQGGPGYVDTITIATNGLITKSVIDILNFDSSNGSHPSMVAVVDNAVDNIFAIAYEGQASDGRLCTVGIASNGQIQNTVIDYLRHESVTGADPSILHIYGNIFVVAYQAQSGIGRVRSFEIAEDGTITHTPIDTVEFEAIFAANPHIMVADIVGTLTANMYVQPAIKTYGATYTGTEYSTDSSEFTTQSYTWDTNPYTGSAWTWSEVNSLQAGIALKVSKDDIYATCTQVYVVVDYDPAYNSTGTFTSTNLLSGQTVCSADSFDYNASAIPSGTTLKVQFSQDNTNWYNSAGTLNGWSTLSSGTPSISLSRLNWSGANFYYKMKFTSDGIDTPVLDEITINYNEGYYASGMLTSSAFDGGEYPVWNWGTVSFTINEPTNTDIKFQIRTASTEAGLSSATWYGPTGTDDYYTTSNTAINPVQDGDRWIQYKAYFSTSTSCSTPTLHDITIAYTIDAPPYKIEVIGGSYCMTSGDSSEWRDGWSVIPEFYCEVTQR